MKTPDRTFQPRLAFLAALTAYAVLCKLIPYILFQVGVSIDPANTVYPWNFSPVPALCLFAGAFFREVRWALAVPLVAWFLGDLGILALVSRQYGFHEGLAMAFYPDQFLVYIGFGLVVACGLAVPYIKRKLTEAQHPWAESLAKWHAVIGAGLVGSTIFYVLTNFGVWAMGEGMMYPLTSEGLADCYIKGLPFFRNYAIATAGFSIILFSPIGVRMLEQAEAQQPAYERV
jgi:hypothetical protein